MTKKEFFMQLRQGLAGLPQAELEERLLFYSEMIEDRIEEGYAEEDAVAAVGSVEEIIAQIVAEIPLATLVKEKIKPKKNLSGWVIALLVLGAPIWLSLLIAAVSVVFAVYISLWSVILSLWASFAAVAASALGILVGGIYFIGINPIFTCLILIGAGLACIGVSILLFFGCKLATKGLIWLTKLPIRIIKNAIVRKGNAV
ncbi:MAG: DUF1700 domain-containing protein [Clostridia bacterium]|nr:DUF1700 domain-containing protein [Clostridia bacterium]